MEIKSKAEFHDAQQELKALEEALEYIEDLGVGEVVSKRIEALTTAINQAQ